jgi:hypothetical protein
MGIGYSNVKSVVVVIADPIADTIYPLLKVSSRMAHIEILEAWACMDTTITLGNGTGIALTLLDYGAGGTVNTGTISSVLGGTAVTWTTDVPKDFVLAEGTFTGGRYIALKYDETGTVAPLNMTVGFNYVEGASA